jgi:hypothetical protein
MPLLCLIGRHRRSLRHVQTCDRNGYVSRCEHCAKPMVRVSSLQWRLAGPDEVEGRS